MGSELSQKAHDIKMLNQRRRHDIPLTLMWHRFKVVCQCWDIYTGTPKIILFGVGGVCLEDIILFSDKYDTFARTVDKHIIDVKFDLTQLSSDDDQCTAEPFNIYMAKSQSTEA